MRSSARRSARLLPSAVTLAIACTPAAPPSKAPEPRPIQRPGVTVAPEPFSPRDTVGLFRIRFASGTTSGILDDNLPPGRDRGYLIGALQGQVMLAHAISWPRSPGEDSPDAAVRLYRGHDGFELPSPAGAGPLWFGRLPGTGDYLLRVSAPAERGISYTLAVQIPRRLLLDSRHPGTEVAAKAPSRAPVDFLVKGEKGQVLRAELRGAAEAADAPTLAVYSLEDGKQMAPLAERRRQWFGVLPTAQDYVVSVVPAGHGAQYDLMVEIR